MKSNAKSGLDDPEPNLIKFSNCPPKGVDALMLLFDPLYSTGPAPQPPPGKRNAVIKTTPTTFAPEKSLPPVKLRDKLHPPIESESESFTERPKGWNEDWLLDIFGESNIAGKSASYPPACAPPPTMPSKSSNDDTAHSVTTHATKDASKLWEFGSMWDLFSNLGVTNPSASLPDESKPPISSNLSDILSCGPTPILRTDDSTSLFRSRYPPIEPCSQTNVELQLFVDSVQSIKSNCLTCITQDLLNLPDSTWNERSPMIDLSYTYDAVYNELTEDTKLVDWMEQEGMVANVSKLCPRPVHVAQSNPGCASVLQNTRLWTIPQIEIRISTKLDNTSTNSAQASHSRQLSSKYRFNVACDPSSTRVNELMLEAVANDVLSPGLHMDVNNFQLRLHGRAELLHPDALLCDCNHIQTCHRLDVPIRLIIESRTDERKPDLFSNETDTFDPQSSTTISSRVPPEEQVLVSYSIYQNSLDKVYSLYEDFLADKIVHSESELSRIQQILLNFSQSMKAFQTVVFQWVEFSDLTRYATELQILLLELFNNREPPEVFTGPTKASHVRDSKPRSTIDQLCLSGLEENIAQLEQCLLNYLRIWFEYQEIGLRISTNLSVSPPGSNITDAKENGLKRSTNPSKNSKRCASKCSDPFTVGLVAIHRVVQSDPVVQRSETTSDTVVSGISGTDNIGNFSQTRDSQFYTRIGLTYAGRPLGRIFEDFTEPTLNSSGRSTTTVCTDAFVSDAGRIQANTSGLRSTLRFDQWFKFPSYPINRLPRETQMSISVFSRKRHSTDNTGADVTLIGWVNIPIFDARGRLKDSTILAGLWPPSEAMHECRPTWSQSNRSSDCPVVQLVMPDQPSPVIYPRVPMDLVDDQCVRSSSTLMSDVRYAIFHAKNAVLLQTIDPSMSNAAVQRCLSYYSSAASSTATHRLRGQQAVDSSVSAAKSIPHLDLQTLRPITNRNSPQQTSNIDSISCSSPMPPRLAVQVLWNLRDSLVDVPEAFVALLLGVLVSKPMIYNTGSTKTGYADASLKDLLTELYRKMLCATTPEPGLALRLLGPDVADQGIRYWAVRSLSLITSDVLLCYLPQIVEAVNHDLYLNYSGLVSLLLYRAVTSLRFANSLYWQLVSVCQSASIRSTSVSSPEAPSNVCPSDWRLNRFNRIKSALLWLVGKGLSVAWAQQEVVLERLAEAALAVKQAKQHSREDILFTHLRIVEHLIHDKTSEVDSHPKRQPSLIALNDGRVVTENARNHRKNSKEQKLSLSGTKELGLRLPHDPGLITHHLDVAACSYFSSFTLPLRLIFHALDSGVEPIMVMFKLGDDLRLDKLILQLTFLMDRMWLFAGLDLRMIHFNVASTGVNSGLIELVSQCSTLRQIQQQEGGLTGAFNETVITKWLQTQSITEYDYRRALDNFLRSLAGCCVTTYILGVGDRHNDNILIRYSGHLFHVDFAKVFGNVQTFAGVKRDRVPFVLTQDMVHVLQEYSDIMADSNTRSFSSSDAASGSQTNKPKRNREGFQLFIDRCCQAYNIIRRHTHAIISVLEMSLAMDIPGVTRDSVRYVFRTLRPELTENEATQHFTKLIWKTLHSRSVRLNFFVHSLAQAKQSNASSSGGGPGSLQSPSEGNIGLGEFSRLNQVKKKPTSCTQLFSFNPKVFSVETDEPIEAVVIEVARKRQFNQNAPEFYFPVNVFRRDCKIPSRIYRRLSDWFELFNGIRSAGWKLDPVFSKSMQQFSTTTSATNVTSVDVQASLQSLIDFLLDEDEVISQSDLVYTFFHSVLVDEAFSSADTEIFKQTSSSRGETEADTLYANANANAFVPDVITTNPSQPLSLMDVSVNRDQRPAVELQLYLTENRDRLDILVKHGRSLFLPLSTEEPDVYVKLYILSGCKRKATKRKTRIIRRCSSPSFNAAFTYMLTPFDLRAGFLEVSVWHSISFGENISIGQTYIQLHSLRPGQSVNKWYTISSNTGAA